MKKIVFCILFSTLIVSSYTQAQINASNISNEKKYFLVNDTLFSDAGSTITVGKIVIAGKGSENNGWYSGIRFKSPLNWSLLLFRESELKTTYSDNANGDQVRENDKLKDLLNKGDSLIVKKIKKKGNRKIGYIFEVQLKKMKFPKTNFICNIDVAIKNREIII